MTNKLQQFQTCEETVYQPLTVRVPVSVTPFVNLLDSARFRCGDPIIKPGCLNLVAMEGESCIFTIMQNISVEIPIEFGATAEVGNPLADCGRPLSTNIGTGGRNRSVVRWTTPNIRI